MIKNIMKHKHRVRLTAAVGLVLAGSGTLAETSLDRIQQSVKGDRYRFAIIADPQVSEMDHPSEVAYNARVQMAVAAEEINSMEPRPAFVIHLGDLVNVFNKGSVETYMGLAGMLEPPNVLVHGNHDTHAPYDPFLEMQTQLTGISVPYYSFDVGAWHFIITPCNLYGREAEEIKSENEMLAWLENDLEANKDRPTIFLNHLHFMPQGLSQTEFYFFPLELRRKLLELMTRHGNVKYYFNGHVHNGIQTAEKTAWEYKGIKFISVPTIIQPRPYGEEFPPFADGVHRGGYYLIVDVDGEKLTLIGRLSGVEGEHVFKDAFAEFKDEEYPGWFRRIVELPAKASLENGRFEEGLQGWTMPQRYEHGTDPFFVADSHRFGEKTIGRLLVKSPVKSAWCVDEYHQFSQMVAVDPSRSPVLGGAYYIPREIPAGGAYLIALLMQNEVFKGMMMFHCGNRVEESNYLPRCYGYAITGREQSWLYFQQLGRDRKAMFWDLPMDTGQWHNLTADLGSLYDQGHGNGAYQSLGVNKVLVAAGIWNYTFLENSRTEAYFTGMRLEEGSAESVVDGVPLRVDETNFTVECGQALADDLREEELAKYPVLEEGNLVPDKPWEHRNLKRMATIQADVCWISDDSIAHGENGWLQSQRFGVAAGWKLKASWTWQYEDADKMHITFRYFDESGAFIGQDERAAKGASGSWIEEFQMIETPEKCRLMDVVINTYGDGTGKVGLKNVSIIKLNRM